MKIFWRPLATGTNECVSWSCILAEYTCGWRKLLFFFFYLTLYSLDWSVKVVLAIVLHTWGKWVQWFHSRSYLLNLWKGRHTAVVELPPPFVAPCWIYNSTLMSKVFVFRQLLLSPPTGFQWSGCSDNLSYGVAFSQTFVDEPERAKGLSAGRPLMNLHNNEAGRKVDAFFFSDSFKSVTCHPYVCCPRHSRPSFTTCRWSVSVTASLGLVSWGPAGKWCLHLGALALC